MNTTLKKCKKVLASLFLAATMVMIVSPTVKGNEDYIKREGFRDHDEETGKYRSRTHVLAYDGRGYAYNLCVSAKYGSKEVNARGSGNVTAETKYYSKKLNADHAYQIGNREKVTWWENTED